jgi:GAF domain-containing protein
MTIVFFYSSKAIYSTTPIIILPNVNKFAGHIACNPQAKSEIVVPMFDDSNNVIAVLDVDSMVENDFDEIDKVYLSHILSWL